MRIFIVLMLIIISIALNVCYAQYLPEIFIADQSIAVTDNTLSPLINPAAIGYGNSNGIGWMNLLNGGKWQNHYWLFSNNKRISYVYKKISNHINKHTLATGFELNGPYIIPNLRKIGKNRDRQSTIPVYI